MNTRRPHDDFLGQPIEIDNLVVGSGYGGMRLYKVVGTSPKMIKVKNLLAKTKNGKKKVKAIYGRELLRIDESQALICLLKYGTF